MTYPHATCKALGCDKDARIGSDYCSLDCLNEDAMQRAAEADADPGDEQPDA